MPSDAICVLHTQIPREPRTEPNEPRFRKILLGLVSVYWLLISVRSRSRPRSKKPDRYRFEPPNRYRAPSSLGSFAGLRMANYMLLFRGSWMAQICGLLFQIQRKHVMERSRM